MKAIFCGVAAALVLAVATAQLSTGLQKPAYESFATEGARITLPAQ